MTSNAPISVSNPADILSYIPHVLGFQPQESLVFLSMSGKRIGATLRLDLPMAEADPLDYAQSVRSYLEADTSADGVLMVLYTDRAWREPCSPPYADLVHCLDLVLETGGLGLLDGWLVSSSHWRDYFCLDAACCPWPGHPLASITESVLNAELVYQGSAYEQTLEAAVGTLASVPSENIQRLTSVYSEQWKGKWDRTSLGRDSLILWNALITNPDDTQFGRGPEPIAFLLAGLQCAAIRDSVIVLSATGLAEALDATEHSGVLPVAPEEQIVPPECALLLSRQAAADQDEADGGSSVPTCPSRPEPAALFREVFLATLAAPNWTRMDCAHTLFLRLAGITCGEPRSALLSILGWIEWARGRGSRAHRYLQEALAETPGYTLGELLLALVGTGSLSPWARSRETAWTSDSRSAA
ncbi:DUF4192 domain-containing protein [Arthrobacter sp. JZ12]|uniref:DUF4192 domain-containing protein n=1 Tax=Arthrobacter sp. JZ12 TaxID=2654190 RepID=UPI002B4AAB94|nr:DUF4192 domain-containing protein [Arthrobacter sp. JZ12]